jgi:hypothetical protein
LAVGTVERWADLWGEQWVAKLAVWTAGMRVAPWAVLKAVCLAVKMAGPMARYLVDLMVESWAEQ